MAKVEMPMVPPSLPGNSYEEKNAQENESTELAPIVKPKKVAQGKVRKQSLLRKFGNYIFEDTIAMAKEYTFKEILLPGIRNLIFDTFNEMLARMLFKDEAPRASGLYRNITSARRVGQTSYTRYYDAKQSASVRGSAGSYRDMPRDPDDITLDTRADAIAVLNELDAVIRQYGQASIVTYYDIVGISGEWPDSRYGWTSIRGAQIKPTREGFTIILPPTILLD